MKHLAGEASVMSWRMVVLALGLVLSAVGGIGDALAQDPGPAADPIGFGLRPASAHEADPTSFSYFTHHVEPGEQLTDMLVVVNDGAVAVRLKLSVMGGMTAVNGGTAFGVGSGGNADVAGWVTIEEDEVSLGPGEEQTVAFVITVPTDAAPGEHVAGIVAQPALEEGLAASARPAQGAPQFSVEVIQRMGVAVVVEVDGERVPALDAVDVRTREQTTQGAVFEIRVHNTGNVMVTGHGTVIVSDPLGTPLASVPFEMDTILAGDGGLLYVQHPLVLQDGDYLLQSVIRYSSLRGNDAEQVTSTSKRELHVQSGQPNVRADARPVDTGPEIAVVGPAATTSDRRQTPVRVLSLSLAAAVLGALVLVLWRRAQ